MFDGTQNNISITSDAYFLCAVDDTGRFNYFRNWTIGLGVGLAVVLIVRVALFLSGTITWYRGGGGAGFGNSWVSE